MQRLCVLLSVVIAGGLAGICAAQDATYYGGPYVAGLPHHQVAHGPATYSCGGGPALVGHCCSCRHSAPCCNHTQRTTVMAHVGSFNCGCRGSYKFPVPPQYTYHWPGMYAQQCMTAYRSPWRFPSLLLYQNQLARARDTSARMVRLGAPPSLRGPDNSKPVRQ